MRYPMFGFVWWFVFFFIYLNFSSECNLLRPRSSVKGGCLCILKSNGLGPSDARRNPLDSQGTERQVAEDRHVCEGHWQPAARHSGGSNHARTSTLPREQDFEAKEKKKLPALIKIY